MSQARKILEKYHSCERYHMMRLLENEVKTLNDAHLRMIVGKEDYIPTWVGIVRDILSDEGICVDEVTTRSLGDLPTKEGDVNIIMRALQGTPGGDRGVSVNEIVQFVKRSHGAASLFVTDSTLVLSQYRSIIKAQHSERKHGHGYLDCVDGNFFTEAGGNSWLNVIYSALQGVVAYLDSLDK